MRVDRPNRGPTACFGQRDPGVLEFAANFGVDVLASARGSTPTAVGSVGCVGKVVDFVPNRPQAARAAPATRLPARNVRLLSRRSGESDTPVVPFLGIPTSASRRCYVAAASPGSPTVDPDPGGRW